MEIHGAEPAFWAFEVPAGGSLQQSIPRGAQLCLTAAGLSTPSAAQRTVLWAESAGCVGVLCNLSHRAGHSSARLAQPFSEDVTLSAEGEAAIHVSGWVRGDLGPLEVLPLAALPPRAVGHAGAAPASAPAPASAVGVGERAVGRSIAATSRKAISSTDLMGVEPEEEEEGEEDGGEEEEEEEDGEEEGEEEGEEDEEGEEEEEAGEEEGEEEEGEEEEGEEEEEEGEMPLAPASVKAALQGASSAKPLKSAIKKPEIQRVAPSKPAPAAAAAPPAKPAAPTVKRLANGLEVTDTKIGAGKEARAKSAVHVRYRGTLLNGKQFDAGKIKFKLGAREVIAGWDLGIEGMKVGGHRKLKIPAPLAYGKRGAPPKIPGNATLLFDVELLSC